VERAIEERCYVCNCLLNKTSKTRDHVPAKNLFIKPHPEYPRHLITLPCCVTCNKKNRVYDEYFRVLVSMSHVRSEAAELVWSKVEATTLPSKRIQAHILDLIRTMKPIAHPEDGRQLFTSQSKAGKFKRYLKRMTLGLLAYHYPEISWNERESFEWTIIQIPPFKLQKFVTETEIMQSLQYDCRGRLNEFRFWRGEMVDRPKHFVWLYIFLDSNPYLVIHTPRTKEIRKSASVVPEWMKEPEY